MTKEYRIRLVKHYEKTGNKLALEEMKRSLILSKQFSEAELKDLFKDYKVKKDGKKPT